ncbi:toxin-antitoxin system TumE family protein [Desulfobacter vibrioformis]|uniref:toxin-antitoxin system TumE family protein n=1 Tax=Desulfobacter vibrioformis TaxID=34031 RepID=UPI0005502E24|nr:DUF6516 family protein [Desulfobacter vibrioformis]
MNDKYGSLDTLLDLDGEIFPMDNGYWVKFTAKQIHPDQHAPHGIRYSMSLHDRHNTRIIGFDNAHAVKSNRKKGFAGRIVTWDHQHNLDKVEPYTFDTSGQLLEDFWAAVDEYLQEG